MISLYRTPLLLRPSGSPFVRATLVALILSLTGILSSCGASPTSTTQGGGSASGASPETAAGTTDAGYPLTLTDDAGREVTIDGEPENIASMAPSITETLFAVGAGDRVVGVTTSDDYPEEVTDIETVGDFSEINVEQVLALDTDLLFVSFDTTAERADELEEQTDADVVVVDPGTLDEVLESVELVGRAAGEPQNGRRTQEEMRSELDAIESAVAGEPEPTVFYEVFGDPLQTVGPGSFIDDAIGVAGGENIAAGTGEAYPTYSAETVIERDPDFYLVGSFSGTDAETVAERPGFSNLSAVEGDRVKVIDDDLISRPGPRVADGVRQIAQALHPNADL
ncbi:ABC transporter substrate-binding protein [Rubrobacter indicoceani]|uniref:ABC transporter substrate-binding protein n=1 Tax=Rubrobacter indicoceani TaxID=2051957 RepID=UPI000E5A5CE3|nr:helical backbone metal receptor [Rubrobacter indicoceani]